MVDPAAEYQKQWYEQSAHAHQRFGSMSHQMTPEDMVIHSASQLQNPRGYEIDPALGGVPHHAMAYPQEDHYKAENGRQSLTVEYGANYGEDSQMIEGRSDEQDEVDSLAGNGPAKKVSKSSAANELEMRQLFQSNKHRTLPEVATELHGNERGPQSERQRQVFAMLWYVFVLVLNRQQTDFTFFTG
jgi:regulatory factor X